MKLILFINVKTLGVLLEQEHTHTHTLNPCGVEIINTPVERGVYSNSVCKSFMLYNVFINVCVTFI